MHWFELQAMDKKMYNGNVIEKWKWILDVLKGLLDAWYIICILTGRI